MPKLGIYEEKEFLTKYRSSFFPSLVFFRERSLPTSREEYDRDGWIGQVVVSSVDTSVDNALLKKDDLFPRGAIRRTETVEDTWDTLGSFSKFLDQGIVPVLIP